MEKKHEIGYRSKLEFEFPFKEKLFFHIDRRESYRLLIGIQQKIFFSNKQERELLIINWNHKSNSKSKKNIFSRNTVVRDMNYQFELGVELKIVLLR